MDFVSLSSRACPRDSFQVFFVSHFLPFASSAKWIEVHQAVSAQYASIPFQTSEYTPGSTKNQNVIKEF